MRATLLCAGLVAAANVNGRDGLSQPQPGGSGTTWSSAACMSSAAWARWRATRDSVPDYVLPNNGYLETCAAIGAGFFHHNMNLAFADARYADELERVLFNGDPERRLAEGRHVLLREPAGSRDRSRTRWAWHGCPCCPPMFLKIMGALPGYVYAADRDGVYVNLFVGSRAAIAVEGVPRSCSGRTTRYPWDGEVRLLVEPERDAEFAVNVRLPAWCGEPRAAIERQTPGNLRERPRLRASPSNVAARRRVELSLPMPVQRIQAHPKVEADAGRVALQRGPLVYCLEAVDNDSHVRNLAIPPDVQLRAQFRADLLGGVTVIQGQALALHRVGWPDALYLPSASVPGAARVEFTAIPYFANANRQPGEMRVWMPETAAQAEPLPPPTPASRATPSASRCWQNDTLSALNDQIEPATSDDTKIPRFTWWDHRGTQEWVQYDFDRPTKISGTAVYWWDERRIGAHCRVPQSWNLLYKDGNEWKLASGVSDYGTKMDEYNHVKFDSVTTTGLRMEVQLRPEWSGGILEWRVE